MGKIIKQASLGINKYDKKATENQLIFRNEKTKKYCECIIIKLFQ